MYDNGRDVCTRHIFRLAAGNIAAVKRTRNSKTSKFYECFERGPPEIMKFERKKKTKLLNSLSSNSTPLPIYRTRRPVPRVRRHGEVWFYFIFIFNEPSIFWWLITDVRTVVVIFSRTIDESNAQIYILQTSHYFIRIRSVFFCRCTTMRSALVNIQNEHVECIYLLVFKILYAVYHALRTGGFRWFIREPNFRFYRSPYPRNSILLENVFSQKPLVTYVDTVRGKIATVQISMYHM